MDITILRQREFYYALLCALLAGALPAEPAATMRAILFALGASCGGFVTIVIVRLGIERKEY